MELSDVTGYCLIDEVIDHQDGGGTTMGSNDCNKVGRGRRLINHSDCEAQGSLEDLSQTHTHTQAGASISASLLLRHTDGHVSLLRSNLQAHGSSISLGSSHCTP